MTDYGPLTPSNRLEWFLMNGGSGGSGGGGGSNFKDVEVAIANDTGETVYCVFGASYYEDGVAKIYTTIIGVSSGNTAYDGFNVPESAESIQYLLRISGAYNVSAEDASVSPGAEWTDVTIGETTFKQYTITAGFPIDELNITISEVA